MGISGDKVENLKVFKKANNLNFTLLSDDKGVIATKFGVPTKQGATITKTVNGKEISLTRGVTESRWTFIIDKSGRVIYKDTQVKPAEDSQRVINFLKNLKEK